MRFIHIGTLKTGSTAIQSFMEANADRLSAQGILYPEAARHGRHKHLYLKQELRKSHGQGGADWAALHAELKASTHAKVLISDEGFALLDGDDVKSFHQLLGPGDTTVVAYFRDYASWLPSLYAEYTKNGRNLLDFDGYFEEAMARPTQAQVIALWAEAFGWERVQVRLFSAEKLVGGDVVEDMLDVLGTSRAKLGVGPDEPVRAAPGWEALEIARAVLSDIASTPGATVEERIPLFVRGACMQAVTTAAPAGRSKAEYLSADQRRRCDERTVQDLAFLNQHLAGASLALPPGKPVVERPFLPSVEQVPSATVAAAMAQLAVLLAAQVPDGTVERKRRVQRKAAAAAKSADGSTKDARRERKKAKKQAETPEQRSERKARKTSRTSA
jgi:hypothetical protein